MACDELVLGDVPDSISRRLAVLLREIRAECLPAKFMPLGSFYVPLEAGYNLFYYGLVGYRSDRKVYCIDISCSYSDGNLCFDSRVIDLGKWITNI